MKDSKIIIVDDNMRDGLKEPFVRILSKLNPNSEISVFTDPSEGLNYVLANLQSRMIVFLDCKFDGSTIQGFDILRDLRKKTSLVYVIMMSVNQLRSFDDRILNDLVNEDFISFFDRNQEPSLTTDLINKAKHLWKVRFDCVLENWIHRHPEDMDKVVLRQNNESYTWARILHELHQQSEVGKSFERMIHQFYIHQFP